jgi:hypothetical protein
VNNDEGGDMPMEEPQ